MSSHVHSAHAPGILPVARQRERPRARACILKSLQIVFFFSVHHFLCEGAVGFCGIILKHPRIGQDSGTNCILVGTTSHMTPFSQFPASNSHPSPSRTSTPAHFFEGSIPFAATTTPRAHRPWCLNLRGGRRADHLPRSFKRALRRHTKSRLQESRSSIFYFLFFFSILPFSHRCVCAQVPPSHSELPLSFFPFPAALTAMLLHTRVIFMHGFFFFAFTHD